MTILPHDSSKEIGRRCAGSQAGLFGLVKKVRVLTPQVSGKFVREFTQARPKECNWLANNSGRAFQIMDTAVGYGNLISWLMK